MGIKYFWITNYTSISSYIYDTSIAYEPFEPGAPHLVLKDKQSKEVIV